MSDGKIWRPCPGFSAYEVSECGDVRRISGSASGPVSIGQPLKGGRHGFGYRVYRIFSAPRTLRSISAHRLVCEAWHGARPSAKHEVAHIDGDPTNNHFSNLRWATHAENEADKWRHGTIAHGEHHRFAKLTLAQVEQIRSDTRPTRFLVAEYGVARSTVQGIRSGRTWKAVAEDGPRRQAALRHTPRIWA